MAKRVYAIEQEPYLKALFYGQPGSTKTRTCATAALDDRLAPVLHLNAAGNPLSIRDYAKHPDIVTIEALSEFNPIYEWLVLGQKKEAELVKVLDLNPPYKTLVVDGVTEVQRFSFGVVIGNTNVKPGDVPKTAEIQHFNKVLGQMTTFARLFFGLPMNVIMTSLEREDKDESTGALMYKPLLWGQSAGEVSGYAYIVARLVHRARLEGKILRAVEDSITEKTVSVALFQPSGRYIAKDQYGALGPFMADPTIPKMVDLIWRDPIPNPT